MKTVKLETIQKQIRDGRVECLTDLEIGYVEIRKGGKRQMVEVTK